MPTTLNPSRPADRLPAESEVSTAGFLERTSRLLDRPCLEQLRKARVLIAGCGGVGGAAALTLARLGVGHFRLADPGCFDEPDINRQWAADTTSLGRNKALVYGEWLKRVNPSVKIEVHSRGVREDNIEALAANIDLAIDCLDISVDLRLRERLFTVVRAQGGYSITAPVLGFGVLVVISAPGGMSMKPFLEILERTASTGKLPPGLRRVFAPLSLEALERDFPTGKLPSSSVGPALGGALVGTEALLILLKGRGPREPICLPRILMTDALTGRHQLVDLAVLVSADEATDRAFQRSDALRAAGFNTHHLQPGQVEVDLLTDSWSEIAGDEQPSTAEKSAEERFREIYGYSQVRAVSRGRFAEAILASTVVRPGSIVAANALFPSTRFHLESRGAEIVDLGSSESSADLDLQRLQYLIAANDRRPLSCVWIEPCANALGGAPLALENLRNVYASCRSADVPVVLDATRLLDNVQLDGNDLQEFTRHSDACTLSAGKDFRARHGGFLATHCETLYARVNDVLLAFGNGLTAEASAALAGAMQADPFPAVRTRVEQVRLLHRQLDALGVPLLPLGGHAIVVDAGRLLPHLTAEEFPVQALANELYLRAGVRGGQHFLSSRQREQGRALLRLAVPIQRYESERLQSVVEVFAAICQRPGQVCGLKKVFQPTGAMGEFVARYEPLGGVLAG